MPSAFPDITDAMIEQIVDMEQVSSSDYAWRRIPAVAVLLAVEVLKQAYGMDDRSIPVIAMAEETLWRFSQWRSKELDITEYVRRRLYLREYGAGKWEEWYEHEQQPERRTV